MTDKDRWLLPEGIEETLPEQAQRLEQLRRSLLDLFSAWGYELVIPPFIEYLDSLLTGTGSDLDLQTLKVTDQLTGRMMGVRADMTPQVARIDAHHLRRETPVRLCYLATTLLARPDGIARTRSPLQVGAELYGYSGIDSDVEVIRLMLEVLSATGVSNVHVDLGHVGIFRGLAAQAGLNSEQEDALFDALQRKAKPEIDSLLSESGCSKDVATMIAALIDLNGDMSVLKEARQVLASANPDVLAALENLENIATALQKQASDLPVYFDLAELRGYSYHTGAVFAAYVPGHGQAIAQGGRYDDIGNVFGNARPATGFSADLRTLMMLGNTNISAKAGIFAPADNDPALQVAITELRNRGERVICGLPGQVGGAKEMNCDRQLVKEGSSWSVTKV